jgi:hypothetical protein
VHEIEKIAAEIKTEDMDDRRGYVIYHNWVVNTPMEAGMADSLKAVKALGTASRFSNTFGMYVTGIDRDKSSMYEEVIAIRRKVFSYTGAVMTLPTGVQAVAESRYGRTGRALEYLKKLSNSFSYSLPGSMYEVSPDFGMMTQAWNIYGVAVPIVRYFLGIHPAAYDKIVWITPNLPEEWSFAGIERLPVGDNFISLDIHKTGVGTIYRIRQDKKDWQIILELTVARGAIIQVNRFQQPVTEGENRLKIRMTGEKNEVWIH